MSDLSGLRARPLWLRLGWTMIFLIVYLSLTPAPVQLPVMQGDKTFEVADRVANAIGVAAGWLFAPPRLPNYLQTSRHE